MEKNFFILLMSHAIMLQIGDLKVNLGQKMRVKVNGKKVNIPYRVANQLDINRTDDSVIVNTRIGIKVHWDGISFLEVSVPSSYRGQLCGLCGNFNSQIKDDFTARHGRVVQDPQQFGQSWIVGGAKKTCPRTKFGNNTRQRRCRERKDQRYFIYIILFNFLINIFPKSIRSKMNIFSLYQLFDIATNYKVISLIF